MMGKVMIRSLPRINPRLMPRLDGAGEGGNVRG